MKNMENKRVMLIAALLNLTQSNKNNINSSSISSFNNNNKK